MRKKKAKRKNKYTAYRGLILFYHRGKGPVGETLANFVDVLGRDGKSNERQRKQW